MAAPMENVCDAMIATVFQSYISNKNNDRVGNYGIRHVLDIVQANELLSSAKSSSNVQDIVSHAHSCLGSSKLRGEGLLLLNVLVKQCHTSVFQQHALTWNKFLIQIIQGHCALPVYSACCQILGQIIIQSKNFSDLTRELTTSVLPQLLPLLISAPVEVCESALCCINHCIRTYPGPIGPFKNKIEAVVLRQLETCTTSQTVYECFALITRCGPGGSGGIKYTEAWTQQCNQTLSSLENTLTQLYDGIETRFSSLQNKECLNLSAIEPSSSNRVTSLVSRWQTLSGCLEALLSVDMMSTVKVPVDTVIQLVCRCLSVQSNMVMCRPTTERTLLASYIPDLHIAALCILDHIIVLCKKNLLTQSSIIVGVLSQELIWTQSENLGFNKQYGYLRSTVYNVITTWLKVLDGCSGIVTEENNLIKQILLDCAPFSETLHLTSGSKTGKAAESSSSKKGKKRKGYQEISQGISTQKKLHPHANSELVTTALDALYWILTTSVSEMSAKKIQETQGFIIQTLLTVQQASDIPIPYSSSGCRKGLYKVLQSLILASHASAPAPTHCAVGIFSVGTLDHDTEVSSVCMEAMKICEVLIHPRAPCLNGPIVCQNVGNIGKMAQTSDLQSMTNTERSLEASNGLDEDMSVDSSSTSVSRSAINENITQVQKNSDTLKRKRPEDLGTSADGGGDRKHLKSVDNVVDINTVKHVSDDDSEVEEISNNKRESVLDQTSADKNEGDDDAEGNTDDEFNVDNESSLDAQLSDVHNYKNGVEEEVKKAHKSKALDQADAEIVSSDDDESPLKPVLGLDDNLEHKTGKENTAVEVENMLSTFIDAGPDSD